MRKGMVGAIVLGVMIVIALIVGFSCAKKVPAGYVGIVYSMNGGISDDILTQGWHLVSPTKEVTLYSIGIEQSYLTSGEDGDSKKDDSFEVPSSDGKGLKVDLTFTYRYDAERVTELFTRFKGQSGKEVRDSFIKPNIISWTKEVTAKYPVTDILGDERANLNIALSEYISGKFEPYGIIVENVSLIDIDADDEQIRNGSGYDHCWVLNKNEFGELSFAAKVIEPKTGRCMECWTTEPGVQIYTDNWADGYTIQHGCTAPRRSAICFEAQHFPDSPNRQHFPPVILNPGERYRQTTIYKFGIKEA